MLSYDVADRLLPAGPGVGTGYDVWGRVTTQPAGLTATPAVGAATVTYHVNDLVASLSQGQVTRTWALDPAQRLATQTVTGAGSGQVVNHYGDPSSDSPTWTTDSTSGTTLTRRYVPGVVGYLAEITTTGSTATTSVALTGLHGDVLRTTSPTATGSPDGTTINADEFGIIRDEVGTSVPGPRYGWLGGKQRPVDTGSAGLTLMGVRLYAPTIGRFLSVDPIYGGNANTYTYPADPINWYDLDGRVAWFVAILVLRVVVHYGARSLASRAATQSVSIAARAAARTQARGRFTGPWANAASRTVGTRSHPRFGGHSVHSRTADNLRRAYGSRVKYNPTRGRDFTFNSRRGPIEVELKTTRSSMCGQPGVACYPPPWGRR